MTVGHSGVFNLINQVGYRQFVWYEDVYIVSYTIVWIFVNLLRYTEFRKGSTLGVPMDEFCMI
jgi:hypothetical protein